MPSPLAVFMIASRSREAILITDSYRCFLSASQLFAFDTFWNPSGRSEVLRDLIKERQVPTLKVQDVCGRLLGEKRPQDFGGDFGVVRRIYSNENEV